MLKRLSIDACMYECKNSLFICDNFTLSVTCTSLSEIEQLQLIFCTLGEFLKRTLAFNGGH